MPPAFDRQRLTEIGHGDLPYWNPLASTVLERMLDAIPLAPGQRVLDVGCGRAQMLLRLIERTGADGIGIDLNEDAIARARRTAGHLRRGAATFEAARFQAEAFADASFDAVLCVGSLHAAGGLAAALPVFARLTRPGSRILIGEGYWKQPPDPAYLAHVGGTADEMVPLESTLSSFAAAGFRIVEHAITSETDWAHYEGTYLANLEAHAERHPDDPEAAAMRDHVRHWNVGFRRWGAGTMGFVLVAAEHSHPGDRPL